MITFQAGHDYAEPLRRTLIEKLREDGAWLVLSVDHYGWRAGYDLMVSLTKGAAGQSVHHGRHLQSLVDLQVQSGLYLVVEQFARLMKAIASHEDGTDVFFSTYMQSYRSIPDLITEVGRYSSEDLKRWFSVPTDSAEIAANSWKHGVPMDTETAREALNQIESTLDQLAANLLELDQLTDRADLTGTGAPVDEGHSLRNVDNAYRHGLKILLHDTLPADRAFGVAIHRQSDPLSEHAVDLYQSDTEPRFVTIDGRPERTAAHLSAIEAISVRTKQAVRGFIARLTEQPAALSTMLGIDPEQLGPSLVDH